MSHITDDDLVLYYYSEGKRRPEIERHLDSCSKCAAAYRDIAGTLTMIVEPAVPDRGEQYGLEVWQRIRHQLPEQEISWWRFIERTFGAERLVLASAAAVLIVLAFAIGRRSSTPVALEPSVASVPAASSAATADLRQRVLIASVADHLDRSERVLTDIMNASEPQDISAEQRWAEDLLTTSRLYRQDAIDIGERSVAEVLDDLERNLIEIVHSPSRLNGADLEQMRRHIDAAALLFKVRVLGDELRAREGGPSGDASPRTPTGKTS